MCSTYSLFIVSFLKNGYRSWPYPFLLFQCVELTLFLGDLIVDAIEGGLRVIHRLLIGIDLILRVAHL